MKRLQSATSKGSSDLLKSDSLSCGTCFVQLRVRERNLTGERRNDRVQTFDFGGVALDDGFRGSVRVSLVVVLLCLFLAPVSVRLDCRNLRGRMSCLTLSWEDSAKVSVVRG